MYLICMEQLNNGHWYSPCGNDGTRSIGYKANWRVHEAAECMMNNPRFHSGEHVEVYMVDYINQYMCEMEPYDYADYVRRVGTFICRNFIPDEDEE